MRAYAATVAMLADMSTSDTDLAPALRAWVDDILKRESLDPTKLARLTGVSQSSLSRFKSGETQKLSPRSVHRLAAHYPTGVPQEVKRLLSRFNLPDDEAPRPEAANDLPGIPIWGVHPIGHTGEFHANAIAVAHLRRPPGLRHARHIIAFYAPDDTMAPRWQSGEPVVVDLNRAAGSGSYALIRLSNPSDKNGDDVYTFRFILRRSDGQVWLGTDNPDDEPAGIPIDRILEARRVLDWRDLLT